MGLPKWFILGYLLMFHIQGCVACDLTKSDKTFVDSTGIEWKCADQCPRIRGCKDQCCEKDNDNENKQEKQDKADVVDKADVNKGVSSRKNPRRIVHVTMGTATGVVIGIIILIAVVAAGLISLKLSKIFNAARQEVDQESADQVSLEELQTLQSFNIAQPSDSEQESTADCSMV